MDIWEIITLLLVVSGKAVIAFSGVYMLGVYGLLLFFRHADEATTKRYIHFVVTAAVVLAFPLGILIFCLE